MEGSKIWCLCPSVCWSVIRKTSGSSNQLHPTNNGMWWTPHHHHQKKKEGKKKSSLEVISYQAWFTASATQFMLLLLFFFFAAAHILLHYFPSLFFVLSYTLLDWCHCLYPTKAVFHNTIASLVLFALWLFQLGHEKGQCVICAPGTWLMLKAFELCARAQ